MSAISDLSYSNFQNHLEIFDFHVGNDLQPDVFDRFQIAQWSPFQDFLDTTPLCKNYFSNKKIFLIQGGSLCFTDLIHEDRYHFVYSGVFTSLESDDRLMAATLQEVIIKVNKCIADDPLFNQKSIQSLKKEARLLQKITNQDPEDLMPFSRFISKGPIGRHHYCLVSSNYSMTLSQFIGPNHLEHYLTHVKTLLDVYQIGFQLLNAIKCLHNQPMGLLHTNLKPSSIAFEEHDLKLRLINLESCKANGYIKKDDFDIDNYFYTPPETLLGLSYGSSSDIWSVGCLMFELFTGMKLFNATNDYELMKMFLAVLGPIPDSLQTKIEANLAFRNYQCSKENIVELLFVTPSQEEFELFSNHFLKYFDCSFYEDELYSNPFYLEKTYNTDETRALFLEFLRSILKWDPDERPSIEELLNTPFMKQMEKLIS